MGKNCIGVYTPYLGGFYFGGILQGIHDAVRERGISILAVQGNAEETPPQLGWDLVDGWIIVAQPDGIGALARRGFPLVTISTRAAEYGCPAVLPDNYGGILAATRHLLDHGHRRIAFVGPLNVTDVQERYAGYQAALAERGIALDLALVFDFALDRPMRPAGQLVGQRMLAAGLPCSAAVVAGDEIAIGLMEAIQGAGYRVPEDLALTGFDDQSTAQYTDPPLSTIRQRPGILGRTAAELLLAQIAGEPVRGEIDPVPTTLIPRRSCGCSLRITSSSPVHTYTSPGWQDLLARDLVQQICFPVPLAADSEPAAIWPGVTDIVQGLAAALESRPTPPLQSLDRAWREALAISTDIEILHSITVLLWRAGTQYVAGHPDDPSTHPRVEAYLGRVDRALMRAHAMREIALNMYLDQLLDTSHTTSVQLLTETASNTQALGWLAELPVRWGCLGKWDHAHVHAAELNIIGSYTRGEAPIPSHGRHAARAFPPPQVLSTALDHEQAHLVALLPIRVAGKEWGVLSLCGPIESQRAMGIEYMGMAAAWLSAALEREQLLTTVADQRETLLELGSPIIPLLPGVLLMPLVGAIDANRARHLMEVLLESVSEQQASEVLLDITGVPVVDTQVAQALLSATRAVTLLGARVTLVGVRPEIAQSIVGLGIDLRGIAIQATLAAAIQALQRRSGQGRI